VTEVGAALLVACTAGFGAGVTCSAEGCLTLGQGVTKVRAGEVVEGGVGESDRGQAKRKETQGVDEHHGGRYESLRVGRSWEEMS
jgi:hypothetical protein